MQVGQVLTGAGGAGLLAWVFINSLKADKETLRAEKSELQNRNDKISDKAIEALVMVNSYLSNHTNSMNSLTTVVTEETTQIKLKLTAATNAITALKTPKQ